MNQEQGVAGKLVASMIRRSVRKHFHTVYWSNANSETLRSPAVLYANHHGWMDGYLMFHLISELGLVSVDWIEEFDSFPLFSKIGGMRFAKGDFTGRVGTIRKTIRLMQNESCSLVLFPEGTMHRPPSLLPFGGALDLIAKRVPNAVFVPIGIYYEQSMHQRPEAWISVDLVHTFHSRQDCEERLASNLENLRESVKSGHSFEILARGTKDVNERWDMRRLPKP